MIKQKKLDAATKKIRKKKCKFCTTEFTPARPLQTTCSVPCAMNWSVILTNKKNEKKWRQDKSILKESLMSLTDYEKVLQPLINRITSILDTGQTCISCGGKGKPQAGHYHPTSTQRKLRFNLLNIWRQDYRCNVELSSNISGYNYGLINTFGKDFKEYLEYDIVNQYKDLKLTKEDLKEAIVRARKVLKDLTEEERTNDQRLLMRKKLNAEIGLYL